MRVPYIFFMIVVFLASSCSITSRSTDKKKAFYTPENWQKPFDSVKTAKPAETQAQTKRQVTKKQTIKIVKPQEQRMIGLASWYGPGFEGKLTANGETYAQEKLTAAHKSLPMNTWLEVTNRENNKTVIVRINDRGPYKEGRIIDLSRRAATKLDFLEKGTASVSLKVMSFPRNYDPQKGLRPYQKFVVQVAVFSSKKRAQAFQEKLANKYKSIPFLFEQQQTETYQVFAGPYNTKNRAHKVSSRLKKQGVENFVRTYKK